MSKLQISNWKLNLRGSKLVTRLKALDWYRGLNWWAVSMWVTMFIFFLLLHVIYEYEENPWSTQIQDVKIFSLEKDTYALWARKDAIDLGFAQITTSINYLLVAAAAVLGFVVNLLIKPDKNTLKILPGGAVIMLKHAAAGCLQSIFYGFYALTSFEDLGDSDSFSVYEDIGPGHTCQIFALLLAVIFLVVAAYMVVNQRWRPSRHMNSSEGAK